MEGRRGGGRREKRWVSAAAVNRRIHMRSSQGLTKATQKRLHVHMRTQGPDFVLAKNTSDGGRASGAPSTCLTSSATAEVGLPSASLPSVPTTRDPASPQPPVPSPQPEDSAGRWYRNAPLAPLSTKGSESSATTSELDSTPFG